VGCIIGKGGSKINEIRHMSASQIKIMEPGAVGVGMNGAPAPSGGEGERLVVITGQPANIQMAVQLLYHVIAATGAGEAEAASRSINLGISKLKWIQDILIDSSILFSSNPPQSY
jgi:heterogeneous nuclear rnp K-like protein 2